MYKLLISKSFKIISLLLLSVSTCVGLAACGVTEGSDTVGTATNAGSGLVLSNNNSETSLVVSSTDSLANGKNTVGVGVDWFTNFQIRPEVLGNLWAAEERAVADCMVARGFQVSAASASQYIQTVAEDAAQDWRSYPLESSVTFEEFAVSRADLIQEESGSAPLLTGVESEAANENLVGLNFDTEVQTFGGLTGKVASDGCLTEARKQVYGDLSTAFASMQINNQRSGMHQRAKLIEPFLSASKEWEFCMKKKGFDFENYMGVYDAVESSENTRLLYEQTLLCTEEADLAQKFRESFNIVANEELSELNNEWTLLVETLDERMHQIDAQE